MGGLIEVRNLLVEPGGEIRVLGPNPMRIQASGNVIVRGLIDLSGFNARNVSTLDSGNQLQRGAAGGPGGGRGGDANVLRDQPNARGGRGNGPFGTVGTGAEGGESGYGVAGQSPRRPGSGGGARFAADRPGERVASAYSLVASEGSDGSPLASGAESGTPPPRGGAPGSGVFVDGKPENDFFGVRPIPGPRGRLVDLIRGELPGLWAGHGGGGGGNGVLGTVFPPPGWFGDDTIGGAGGGGGGTLHVQALGRIVFGAEGRIQSDGGRGGLGVNASFFPDDAGGNGGAGSGGHVVLKSAAAIDFTDGGANAYPASSDIIVPDAVATLRDPLAAVSSPQAYALFLTCSPLAPLPVNWVDIGAGGALRSFVRFALGAATLHDAASELIPLELPRRF